MISKNLKKNGNLIGIAQGGLVQRGVENFRFATKISVAVFSLKESKITNQFDVQVSRRKKKLSPRDIFSEFSSYVVKIEVMR